MQHSRRCTCGEQLAPQEAHRSQGEDISEWQTTGRSPKCTFVHLVSHQFHQLSVLAGSSLRFMKSRRAHWCFLLHQLEQELEMVTFPLSQTHFCLPLQTQVFYFLLTVMLSMSWSEGARDTEELTLGKKNSAFWERGGKLGCLIHLIGNAHCDLEMMLWPADQNLLGRKLILLFFFPSVGLSVQYLPWVGDKCGPYNTASLPCQILSLVRQAEWQKNLLFLQRELRQSWSHCEKALAS